MKTLVIHISKLRESFDVFKRMIEREDKMPLSSIKESAYFKKNEKYKDRISEDVRRKMDMAVWSPKDAGTGRILQAILRSENNLLDWRSIVFLKEIKDAKMLKEYESLCYELYKNRRLSDMQIFERLKDLKEDYRLITYFFFIKNERKYLPLSPRNFDDVFKKMGVEYRASKRCSWENYGQFRHLVGQVQSFLRQELPEDDISLLDAHSYLWLLKMEIKAGKWPGNSPEVESVLKVLREFSEEYPDTSEYQNWFDDPYYIYALVWEERLFPPKEIHARVMGKSKNEFSSGEKTTNRFFQRLGFTIAPKSQAKYNLWRSRIEKDDWEGKETDSKGMAPRRLEQSILRDNLLGNRKAAPCGLCGEVVPAELLIAAHIKKRCECTRAEKLDIEFIAMLMCSLGCDVLYEGGYVGVADGRITVCDTQNLPSKVRNYLKALDGRRSVYWNAEMKKYFDWHYRNVFVKNQKERENVGASLDE